MFIYVAWYCNLYVLRRDKTMFVLIMLMQYHLGERNISFQCIKRYQMALLSCWDSAKFFAICFCIFNLYDNMIFHVTCICGFIGKIKMFSVAKGTKCISENSNTKSTMHNIETRFLPFSGLFTHQIRLCLILWICTHHFV